MATRVLDASVVLAWLWDEAGADEAEGLVGTGAAICAVNLAEVLSKIAERGGDPDEALQGMQGMFDVVDFVQSHALSVGMLHGILHGSGLSLGDRACLATGATLALPIYTAERRWPGLVRAKGLDLEVIAIR